MRDLASPLDGFLSPFGAVRGRVFSPLSLFASGEAGAWYDPSDLSTLYQDSIGTAPVTAAGQPVGLVLDKSQGLTLGAELVTNGTFDTDLTGWTLGGTGGTISWDAGRVLVSRVTGGVAANQSFPTVVGRTYRVDYEFTSVVGGLVRVAAAAGLGAPGGTLSANNQGPVFFTASNTITYLQLGLGSGNGTSGTYDNVSVRELPGNHLTQATAAARPVYARGPETGRRNLLTYTEQFDNAAWVDFSLGTTTVTANFGADPLGGDTADRLQGNNANTWWGQIGGQALNDQTVTFSVWLRANSGTPSGVSLNLAVFLGGTSFEMITVTSEWQRFSVTRAVLTSETGQVFGSINHGNGNDILVWGAQFEISATATAYQRVVSDFDVTEAGVPYLHWLEFDGVDDFMTPPSGMTTGWTAAHAMAGQNQDTGGGGAVLARWGINGTQDHEPFTGVHYSSFGSLDRGTFGAMSTGTDYVVEYERGSSTLTARLNGAASGSPLTTTLGWRTQAYIAGGAGGANFFDGKAYGLLAVNRVLSSGEAESLRAYLAAKSGVTL